jgi:hypothetical protein
MSVFVNRIFGFAMAAALLGGAATTALAQQAQFRLPVQAKWGPVVLPAGDYRVSVPELAIGNSTFLVQGPAGSSFIVPMTFYASDMQPAAATDRLELVQVGGEYFVKKYEANSRALTFFFKTPKPNRREQITSRDVSQLPVSGD